MEGDERRNRLKSFLLGGIVGASAALAAGRRRRSRAKRKQSPTGLAAFEDAPCYRELIERESGGDAS